MYEVAVLCSCIDELLEAWNTASDVNYLYLTESMLMESMAHDWQVGQKLEDVRPGLFFTASGSAFDLRGEIPTWRNYWLKRQ
ncbi:hypothetical protein ACFL5F_05765 [Planctomycetota bacterium]